MCVCSFSVVIVAIVTFSWANGALYRTVGRGHAPAKGSHRQKDSRRCVARGGVAKGGGQGGRKFFKRLVCVCVSVLLFWLTLDFYFLYFFVSGG